MGSCHSVIRGSKKREDISYSDIDYKHGKTLAPREDHLSLTSVFRFCLFMGVSCNDIQNDEEQSPVAVRLPKHGLFLLKQLKNWIANNFSGFNAAKINIPIYQEPIYRSPGAGQQMVNARYSIVLQIENHDAFYQSANRFHQMLPWDAHEPPPKRVTSGGSWYIVSMEVFKDEMDLSGQRPDNPEVHLKVILHIANHRTPQDFNPFDIHRQTETYRYNDVINPCILNYHVDYTLSPEEFCQLVRIQKYLLPNEHSKDQIPKDVRTLLPGLLKFNHGVIHLDCRNLNISTNPNTVLHSSYYKSEDTRTLVPGPPEFNHGAIYEDYWNLNVCRNPIRVLYSSYYKPDLNLNFPNPVPSTINPNPRWFNNEAIHEDHQDVNANRNSKKCPLSTNIKAGNSAAPGLTAVCILLLLAPQAAAYPVPQSRQVGIEILRDSDNLNCTLKIDNEYSLCYGHCDQNQKHHQKIFNDTVEKLLGNVCDQQKSAMETNHNSLMKKHSLSSGILQLILIWKLNRDLHLTDVIIQYIFDGKHLTEKEMTNLPMTIIAFGNADPNSSVDMEKMKDHVKELWGSIREKLLPFLKIDDQPENTNSSVNAKAISDTKKLWIIAITIFVVSFIGAVAIFWNIKCSGKETFTKFHETCLTYRRSGQNETEAEGDPNVMQALKREDHVINFV